jgi:serine/threonine protein kinase
VTLLGTFCQCNIPYLIFPWAEKDLLGYWRHERPSKDTDTALWLAEQCCGLADGLYRIHQWETTSGSDLISKPLYSARYGTEEISQMLLGRHGDIKPKNILWFEDGGRGILKLADFGEAQFHTRTPVLGESSRSVGTSPLYRAPEFALRKRLTPSWDIWGLGCTYLEFITWFFSGWEGVDGFAEKRKSPDPEFYLYRTSTFFEVMTVSSRVKRARVKPSVVKVSLQICRPFTSNVSILTMWRV